MRLYVVLLVLSLLAEWLVYLVGTWTARFYWVLGRRDGEAFGRLCAWSVGLFAASALVKSLAHWVATGIAVKSRKILTHRLHHAYFQWPVFVRLNLGQSPGVKSDMSRGAKTDETTVDNPDQRITQDVDRFTTSLQAVLERLIISPIVIAYYAYQTAAVR